MRILVTGYHNPAFLTVTEYIEDAVKKTGNELIVFDDRKYLFPGALRKAMPSFEMADIRRINERLLALAEKTRPDLCLVTGGHRILRDTVERIKAMGAKAALWTIDVPQDFGKVLSAAPAYDRIFAGGTEALEIFHQKGFMNAFWVPFASSPDIHRNRLLYGEMPGPDARDVVFVGSYYRNREDVLSGLKDTGLGIWGPGWTKASDKELVRKCVLGGGATVDEWTMIFSRAKIVLVIHYQDGVIPSYQASPKLYEAMACGKFVICDRQRDAVRLFKDGKHIVFFKDPEDLKTKIERYLFKKDDRDRIALAGYEEVVRAHKYTDRLNFMINSVRETP